MKKIILGIFLLMGVLTLNSCFVGKKVIFVEDMMPDTTYNALNIPPLKVQKNDRISIQITSKTPELAIPFNQGTSNSYQVDDNGSIQKDLNGGTAQGYLVDINGYIEFPILGNIYVENKSLEEIKATIKEKLISAKLINDPNVIIELLNLKISVLGEVARPNVYVVPDSRITLLEAVSRSGGFTPNSSTDKILVIREEDGVRKMYTHDFKSKDIFLSPAYYLRQNDIVYVDAKSGKFSSREETSFRFLTTGLSLIGIVLTTLNLTK